MELCVSVVVPSHQRPHQLERALRSVFAQTYPPTEVLIVDDNASDPAIRSQTEQVVESVDSRLSKKLTLRYLAPSEALGGAAARNYGVARSHGDLIAFLDDDDWWLSEKLRLQVKLFEAAATGTQAPVGLVYTSRRIVDPDGKAKRTRSGVHRGWIADVLLEENVIGTTSCAMVRRDVFDEVGGFDETLPSRQDVDLWLRIAMRHQIDFVVEPVTVQQEHHEGRISRRFEAKSRGLEMFVKKHYPLLVERPHVLASHYMRIGVHYLKYGRALRGRRWIARAFFARPSVRAFKRCVFGVGGGGASETTDTDQSRRGAK